MKQTSSNEPLSVHRLWQRLAEGLSTVGENRRPEAQEVIDQVNQFLSRYEQMTGERIPARGEQPPQSDEWWQTDAEVCFLLLGFMERAMVVITISDPLRLEFYRIGMRLSLLVGRIESDRAEYFQEKFNDAERLPYM